MAEVDATPEIELESYKAIASGEIRNLGANSNLPKAFETIEFDKPAHVMMSTLTHHVIRLNGITYLVKSAYDMNLDRDNPITNGTLEVYDEHYSKFGILST